MTSDEIRQRFLTFFSAKGGPLPAGGHGASGGEGHKIVPAASLVPENDPSVLFTTAGMQQFKPYYLGQADAQKDFGSLNTVTVQPCVRTSDIAEVGDDSHLTFFEMLGNFSFGGYGKKEAIGYAHEFITQELGLIIDYVSVFGGDPSTGLEASVPADEESAKIWQAIDPNLTIKKFGRADNFWGPTGTEGPCGPTTEIYVQGLEIWNIVFNQYYQNSDGSLKTLPTLGVDTGMGLERLVTVLQNKDSVFETDLFSNIIATIKLQTGESGTRTMRIIADHVRTAVFLIAAGVKSTNTDRGYILRRVIRRAVRYADRLKMGVGTLGNVAAAVVCRYDDLYNLDRFGSVADEVLNEEQKFRQTLQKGLHEFEKGRDPFDLYQTYGFPIELTEELAKEKGLTIDRAKFDEDLRKHQEISRVGSEQKFKGGLGGASEQIIRYHTATHLLNQALNDVLGQTEQRGSNITDERLRFDFTCDHKLTEDEKKKVEEIVNQKIKENLPVQQIILPKAEAEKIGARHLFNEKYGDEISIYYIGDSLATAYSKEFCGGPHVARTGLLASTGSTSSQQASSAQVAFKIVKEEAVASGVRRIKAVLTD